MLLVNGNKVVKLNVYLIIMYDSNIAIGKTMCFGIRPPIAISREAKNKVFVFNMYSIFWYTFMRFIVSKKYL